MPYNMCPIFIEYRVQCIFVSGICTPVAMGNYGRIYRMSAVECWCLSCEVVL